jgi:hypothetical protein
MPTQNCAVYIRMNKYGIYAQCALGDLHLRLKKIDNLESKLTGLRSGSSVSVKKWVPDPEARNFMPRQGEYNHLNNVFQKLVFYL